MAVPTAIGLKPHLTRTVKLSNDPKFAEKVVDIADQVRDRALPQPARQGGRVVCRREEPNTDFGSDTAGPADEEGPCGNDAAEQVVGVERVDDRSVTCRPWLAFEQVHDRRHGLELELLVGMELEFHASLTAV
jgi:hypothetical protein